MKSGLLLSIARCCATGAVCFYLGTVTFPPPVDTRIAASAAPPASQIAIVNMKSLFEAHPEFSEVEDTLSSRRAEARKELQRMEQHEDSRHIRLFREARSKEIEAEQERYRSGLVQDIQRWATMAAEKRGIRLLLDSSESSLNKDLIILHARGIPDITEEVIAEMTVE